MRSLITDMRPAALDELGVAPALETLVERASATSGLDIELHADVLFDGAEEEQCPAPAVETTVYRIVQEALTNVAKHTHASRATVAVVDRDGTSEIAVTDDGRGFREEDAADGFGLIGKRERVRLAGGRHDIESAPGRGTTVHASIRPRAATPVASLGPRSAEPAQASRGTTCMRRARAPAERTAAASSAAGASFMTPPAAPARTTWRIPAESSTTPMTSTAVEWRTAASSRTPAIPRSATTARSSSTTSGVWRRMAAQSSRPWSSA